jgi:hypothetical protein
MYHRKRRVRILCLGVPTLLEQEQKGRVDQEICVMKFAAISIGLATAVLTATPAQAQANNDVRCLLASNLFAKAAKEPKARTAAEAGKLYYLGRIHGRLSPQQLKAELVTQQKTITQKNAGDVMNGCARQMDNGIKMIQSVTQQLLPKKK